MPVDFQSSLASLLHSFAMVASAVQVAKRKMGPKRGPLTRARFDSKHSAPGATQKKQCCEMVSTILKNPCCRENPLSPLDS